MKLTDKQKVFCDEYIIDFNATRAYKAAYKSCKKDQTARANSSRLLTNANVQAYIEKRKEERRKRVEVTQDMVLEELRRIAFAKATDYVKIEEVKKKIPDYDAKGKKTGEREICFQEVKFVNTNDVPLESQSAISSIKEGRNGIVVSTYDKVRALELIGKHLGMFQDKVEVSGGVNINNPYENLSEEQLIKLVELGEIDE